MQHCISSTNCRGITDSGSGRVPTARRVSRKGRRPAKALDAIALAEPETFQRLLNVLYGSYYTAPTAAACVRDLAYPDRAKPLAFRPARFCNVIRTQAGKRRL